MVCKRRFPIILLFLLILISPIQAQSDYAYGAVATLATNRNFYGNHDGWVLTQSIKTEIRKNVNNRFYIRSGVSFLHQAHGLLFNRGDKRRILSVNIPVIVGLNILNLSEFHLSLFVGPSTSIIFKDEYFNGGQRKIFDYNLGRFLFNSDSGMEAKMKLDQKTQMIARGGVINQLNETENFRVQSLYTEIGFLRLL